MPTLVIQQRGEPIRSVEVGNQAFTIGRSGSCTVCIKAPGVSKIHAQLTPTDKGFEIEDAGSKNGLAVNGEHTEWADLVAGDVIQLGAAVKIHWEFRKRAKGENVDPDTKLDAGDLWPGSGDDAEADEAGSAPKAKGKAKGKRKAGSKAGSGGAGKKAAKPPVAKDDSFVESGMIEMVGDSGELKPLNFEIRPVSQAAGGPGRERGAAQADDASTDDDTADPEPRSTAPSRRPPGQQARKKKASDDPEAKPRRAKKKASDAPEAKPRRAKKKAAPAEDKPDRKGGTRRRRRR